MQVPNPGKRKENCQIECNIYYSFVLLVEIKLSINKISTNTNLQNLQPSETFT